MDVPTVVLANFVQLQMLLNRISYLKAEEAKLDRDFIRTQKRTEEMLLMKADRASDIDIYEAARDVLENLHKGLSGKEAAGEDLLYSFNTAS
eukprot:514495-Pelagomonas_calceolata.AAC.8